MFYINSNSPIERELFQYLKIAKKSASQINISHSVDISFLERQFYISPSKTLVYSFLDYSQFSYLDSFLKELDNMELIIDFAKKNNFRNIILLSYPGVYVNSDNLFLQHKAKIENIVSSSNIPFTILSVQSILSEDKNSSSLHSLFYNQDENQYVIPKKKSQVIYNINLKNLVEIILKVSPTSYNNSYDIMDSVYELKEYLSYVNPTTKIERISPIYLNFKSMIGKYMSPTMLDLFLRPIVPMYKSRAEKEFEIELIHQKIENRIKHDSAIYTFVNNNEYQQNINFAY